MVEIQSVALTPVRPSPRQITFGLELLAMVQCEEGYCAQILENAAMQ